jgi:predicted lipoprotein with Yx(FWY)xxD motif
LVVIAAGATAAIIATSGSGSGRTDPVLRTAPTPAGSMVVTGDGLSVYVYLPDDSNPSRTTCIEDCANDWPPVLLTAPSPSVEGIPKTSVGVTTRPDGAHQLTLDGYPLYRFAADHRPGEIRGESIGNAWFAVAPDGNFLALTPVSFQAAPHRAGGALQVSATRFGPIVMDSSGQTLYAYKDDTPTSSACTAEWCLQDWPPVLVKQLPADIPGISGRLGLLRRPDGTVQLTLGDHPLYRFAGDQRPGDLRGQGIGGDWSAVTPEGTVVTGPSSA